jgi:general secretion pathway protein A
MVARAFGLPAESRDKASILKDIQGFLGARRAEGKHVVLVIDEVQNMPLEAIEELRMLSNFQMDNRPLVQCFLLGQPEFREKLARPEMEQIRQRVIATCHLEPLAADETRSYIEHRLKLVGWEGDPEFTDEAFDRIHRVTNGVPRRLNSLCGRLLLYGSLEDTHVIDDTVVQDVAREIAEEAGTGAGYRPGPAPGVSIEGFDPDSGESLADLDRRVAVLRGAG